MTTPTTTKKPARMAAKKAAPKQATTATKITWRTTGEKDARGQAEGVGMCADREYKITGADNCWKATVTVGSKTTTLGENLKSGGAAWTACVRHNKSAA